MARLTQERLKELLNYNPETGIFIWLEGKRGIYAGSIAGFALGNYIAVGVDRKTYLAHRLAWLYIYGEFPKSGLDHKNKTPNDNSINNLRECNQSQNLANREKSLTNTSGYKGVYWNKALNKWHSQIGFKGKKIHLGFYHNIEKAAIAYNKKSLELFDEFACLNKIKGEA